MTTDRVEKDGKVAVLVSPGYGAGWSTWAIRENAERLLFDPEMVQAVLAKDSDAVAQRADQLEDELGCYTGGSSQLTVVWVPKGAQFRIDEYDGSETLRTIADLSFTA